MDIFSNTSRARLQALYSDFSRQKQSNPTAFQANVEWWRKALESLVDSGVQQTGTGSIGSRLVLQANRALLDCLRLEKVGKPLAMGAVINDLRSRKILISLHKFMASKTSIYDAGWLPYRIASFVVGRPLWWALEQVGIVGDEGVLTSISHSQKETDWWGEYVFVEHVERAADAVLSLQESKTTGPADALYTLDGFRKSFASVFDASNDSLHEVDTRIILKYLERERRVLVLDTEVVKFIDSTTPHDERIITTVDRGILELKSAISNMQRQVDGIHRKMDEYTNKATTALQQKWKSLALSYLKSRKQLEDLRNKRLVSLSTLESTMLSIETAAGDIQIMKTYETSTATLRAVLSHPSLQRENIDKTMDALAEANQDAREIDNVFRTDGDVAVGVDNDDDDIEEELQALVKGIEDERSAQRLQNSQVPSILPAVDEPVKVKVLLPPN
ncbi:hypothetical protein P691DRAFT_754563 [Macrolepiota fuliginosa MF-IS2]|uniref:Charged multivesicular body protein 7 n=1 Tax=Macrolepiota fuliginosa MF-IS2 TaxID=1400762 RepID=A0A9P5XNA8_9AGAR|nr:hypothetical protein P691DRAFT_754563 [Macrolepiota fuliginosa MF-IS2]